MKIKRKAVYLLLLTLMTLIGRAHASSTIVPSRDEVAGERYWRLLLHMRGSKSEARGFFLSNSQDPKAELDADIEAFSSNTTTGFFGQHPQCAYPERYRYLKERLRLTIKDQPCPEFQQWKSRFRARSVTLVYAAPYLGQAASMFGHTFLRINSAGSELLNQGISFEAAAPPTPTPMYVIKGLFGGFTGMFSQSSYFEKIKTYSHLENRDLWSYELNLTDGEIDRMLNHVWELQNAQFPYYFTNGNCSYHLLSLLEVARPEWELRKHFYLTAIPLDTVKTVAKQPDAIKEINGRPALMRILNQRIQDLSGEQKKEFDKKQSNDPQVIDAILDWRLINKKPADLDLLQTRSKLPEAPPPKVEMGKAPHKGHGSSKVSLNSGSYNNEFVTGLELRPALHDLLDSDTGYIPFSQLLVGEVAVDYFPRLGDFALNRLVLGEVVNLRPGVSWLLGGRVHRPEDLRCFDCLAGQLQGGFGGGVGGDSVLVYGMAKVMGEVSGAFEDDLRGGVSLELAGLARVSDFVKARLGGERFFYRGGEYSKVSFGVAWSLGVVEVRGGVERLEVRRDDLISWRVGVGTYY